MIHQALPWLPPASPGSFERQLTRLAEDWAARWIGARVSLAVDPASPSCDPSFGWRGCPAIAVGAGARSALALGEAALAGQADAGNSRDCEILVSIGRQAVDDLTGVLCEIVSPDEEPDDLCPESFSGVRRWYRVDGPGWALELSLDAAAQVQLRRHLAGMGRRPRLGKLIDALAPVTIGLGCHLGRASLAAAEVAALAPGDLIVLDRRTTDRVSLTVEGAVVAKGKAGIEAEDGDLLVRIADAVDLTAGSD